jgi:Domain of unknown function (DUF4234)
MAQTVVIGNQTFKRRNIIGVWLGLPLITFGIYHLVWYYKINNEARRYLADEKISPGISVLAISLGAFLIIPPFVSVYNTGSRIARMQERAGLDSRIEPVLALLLTFVFGLHTLYMQSHLNRIWDRYLQTAPPATGQLPTSPPSTALPPTSS